MHRPPEVADRTITWWNQPIRTARGWRVVGSVGAVQRAALIMSCAIVSAVTVAPLTASATRLAHSTAPPGVSAPSVLTRATGWGRRGGQLRASALACWRGDCPPSGRTRS